MRITTSSKPCIGLISLISFWLIPSIESVTQKEVAIGSATTKSNAILGIFPAYIRVDPGFIPALVRRMSLSV